MCLYVLTVIPLSYAIILGYDNLIAKLKDTNKNTLSVNMAEYKNMDIDFTVKEKNSSEKGFEEFTLKEVESSQNKRP